MKDLEEKKKSHTPCIRITGEGKGGIAHYTVQPEACDIWEEGRKGKRGGVLRLSLYSPKERKKSPIPHDAKQDMKY